MWKGIVKNQAKYKQAVKYFLKTNKTSNEFIFTLLYKLYFFGPRTIVFISLSSNNITSFIWYGGLLPTVVVADDAHLLNKL